MTARTESEADGTNVAAQAMPLCAGVILAGGQGLRMGGGAKPLRLLRGRPLLSHLLERLRPQLHSLALNVNGPTIAFQRFGLPIIADDLPGYQGPLAGVLAGLDWMAEALPHSQWLLSVPGDCPFIPPDLVHRLQAACMAGAPMACAVSGGRLHPATALWPTHIRPILRDALARGERRIGRIAQEYGAVPVEWVLPAAPAPDPFMNINTPEDLAIAEQAAAALARNTPTHPQTARPQTPHHKPAP